MRVLWICQTVPPEADALIGGDRELKKTGGWILGMAGELVRKEGVELAIASVSPLVKKLKTLRGERITYYIAPAVTSERDSGLMLDWKRVAADYRPDVVHIHGSEYKHALTWVYANGEKGVVVSMQGVMNAFKDFFYLGVPQFDILRCVTLRDLYRETVFGWADRFAKAGEIEKTLLRRVRHVIGRTEWDRMQLWAINPEAQYHFNNEILRAEFYEGDVWRYEGCDKHTIFINQAEAPYKGLHQLVKALPLIARHYPDVRVRVAGFNMCDMSFKRRVMRAGYGRYILRLMKKYGVTDRITFIGPQNAAAMKREMMKANVFLLPSAIENSSNALGEAQMLGVPCVVSRVGGFTTMVPNKRCGTLYRFMDVAELAYGVCSAMEGASTFDNTEMRRVAAERHNRQVNSDALIEIYRNIR